MARQVNTEKVVKSAFPDKNLCCFAFYHKQNKAWKVCALIMEDYFHQELF